MWYIVKLYTTLDGQMNRRMPYIWSDWRQNDRIGVRIGGKMVGLTAHQRITILGQNWSCYYTELAI